MNKEELVAKAAKEAGLSQKDTEAVIRAIFGTTDKTGIIIDAAKAGDPVKLVGFGEFGSRARKERVGRNPQTGDTLVIKGITIPKFEAGKRYKEALL
jgi:DNA-binding protein HU-beta